MNKYLRMRAILNFYYIMINDFKKFVLRGNLVDLAVGLIVGAAFKEVIGSFVKDILMPPIGLALGGVDFADLKYVLQAAEGEVAEVAISYGAFVQTIVDFLIIAASIFMVVKVYEKMQKKEEAKPAAPAKSEVLLEEIRDLMKKKK